MPSIPSTLVSVTSARLVAEAVARGGDAFFIGCVVAGFGAPCPEAMGANLLGRDRGEYEQGCLAGGADVHLPSRKAAEAAMWRVVLA